MKKHFSFIFTIFIAINIISCNEDDYLKEMPRDILTADNLYITPSGFDNGLNAVYALIRQERDNVGNNLTRSCFTFTGTDAYYLSRYNMNMAIFYYWGSNMHSNAVGLEENWVWLYRIINSVNTIIDRAENDNMRWNSQEQKFEIIAQAKCIRAWAYRHLVYLWGDIPLSLNESTGLNIKTDWERSPKKIVMKQMEEDWLFAEQYLPDVHKIPGRLNKVVAQHYLAELYLAMGDPANAEIKALAGINNPNYKLITERFGIKKNQPGVPFMDQFYKDNVFYINGNTEVLWEFPYQKNVLGGGQNIMRRQWLTRYSAISGVSVSVERGRGSNFVAGTDYAFNLYQEGDDRASEFAIHRYVLKDNGDTVYTRLGQVPEPEIDNYRPSTRKWDDGDPDDPAQGVGYHHQPYLRLAETYLLLAEAQFLQNKNDEAAETLNIIRRRSNASEISASQVSIDFILDERVRELFTEEHRRYTLLRLHKWLERTKAFNSQTGPNIIARDTLYPIPQSVIDANLDRILPQNPGY